MEQVKQETVITRTCINRFTGGVMEKRLFSQMPVSGHVRIQVDLVRRPPPRSAPSSFMRSVTWLQGCTASAVGTRLAMVICPMAC